MTKLTDYDRKMLGLPSPRAESGDTIVDAVVIAHVLRVHPRTVQRWILAGKLRAHRKGNLRSHWRVSFDDLALAYWEADHIQDRRMIEAMIRVGLRGICGSSDEGITTR
jgi:excisionase family DNA binding protein